MPPLPSNPDTPTVLGFSTTGFATTSDALGFYSYFFCRLPNNPLPKVGVGAEVEIFPVRLNFGVYADYFEL